MTRLEPTAEYPELRRPVDRELKLIFRDDDLSLLGAGHPRILNSKALPPIASKRWNELSASERANLDRHGRACRGHPRLVLSQ